MKGIEPTAVHLEEYYKSVDKYHQLVEDAPHEVFVVPPGLLRRFIQPGGVVVDVAGGSGINARTLGLDVAKYFCVDLSLKGLTIAREKARGFQIQARTGLLPLKSDFADTVLCSWSLEHMTEPWAVLDEMIRITKPGGRILLWGPNWDNIFRKDFPQFVHKTPGFIRKVRWQMFFRMLRNEFLPFHYDPYINLDVAALAEPEKYLSADTDAVHCVLCQETVKFLGRKGLRVLHLSDFSEMGKYLHNDPGIRAIRAILKPFLPLLRRVPLARWFVIRFPIVVEKRP